MIQNGILQRHLNKVDAIGGYTPTAIGPNEYGYAVQAGFCHSGEELFHRLAEQYWGIYCASGTDKSPPPEVIGDFLAITHSDLTADVYAGCIPKRLKFRAKQFIPAGAPISNSHLADVTEMRFVDIDVESTDSIVYCFRIGWRFGLYFDFRPTTGYVRDCDEELWPALGSGHRFLMFFDEYTAQSRASATGLSDDGWFPFLELLGGEYRGLADLYASPNARRFVDEFIGRFNAERLQAVAQRWWRNPLFQAKEEIFLAGIDSFGLGTHRGAIACLKVLYSEIEGLIRIACSTDKNIAKPTFKDLERYVDEKGRQNFDTDSLAFPDAFYRYVKDHVFASFDLATGDIPLSRHSSSHGVADAATYTRAKALQAILTLDQLSFYLRDAKPGGGVGPSP